MKIYTKTGDAGQTGLFGGVRVDKDDERVEAYGTVDEANAALGIARAASSSPELAAWLEELQSDLFSLGAELACAPGKAETLSMPRIDSARVERLEQLIDEIDARLKPLNTFVLPGGTAVAAALHLARTVARRAERRTYALSKSVTVSRDILVYLNRLSDLLFVLARHENAVAHVNDVPWRGSRR